MNMLFFNCDGTHPATCKLSDTSSSILRTIADAETAFANEMYREAMEIYKGIDNSHSRYMVGLCIANLSSSLVMPSEAEAWFRKSASENNPWALYILDDKELEYQDRLQEANEAMKLFLVAYKGGEWEKFAMYEVGMCFKYGKGVKQNRDRAYAFFKEATSHKCLKAQYELGLCYKEKIGEWQDEPALQALYHFHAATRDVPEAYYELAYAYYHGDYVVKDYDKVVEYLGYATSVNHPPAFSLLGNCYLNECGVEKDEKRAVELFQKAVNLGDWDACKPLAECYSVGCGVEHDAYKAFAYYLISAESGNADAQLFIGNAYLDGVVVPRWISKAKRWYEKAAANGSAEAKIKLAHIKHLVQEGEQGELEASFVSLLNSYEPCREKLQQIASGVEWLIHMPLKNTILFLSKEARIEAIFFIFAVVRKYLEEEHNFKRLEPCIYALCYCLRAHGMEKTMNSLASIWKEARLPSYFSCTKGMYGKNWELSPFFDHQEWVKLLVQYIKDSDSSSFPLGLFSKFEDNGYWKDPVRNAFEEWYSLLMNYGVFDALAESILYYEKTLFAS